MHFKGKHNLLLRSELNSINIVWAQTIKSKRKAQLSMVCLYYLKMQNWEFTLYLRLWISNKITPPPQNHFRVIRERSLYIA